MLEYLIGVDGGGSGTRARLARADGSPLGQGHSGPSALAHGIERAWVAVEAAVAQAFADAGLPVAARADMAIGLGLALMGAEQRGQRVRFQRHGGVTGIVGDEAGGAWIGLRAIGHVQHVLDGRAAMSDFAAAIIAACGAPAPADGDRQGARDAVQRWLAGANQTVYAQLARPVLEHGASDTVAHQILTEAGRQVALIAQALDAGGDLPLALCGGLAAPLTPYLPANLLRRLVSAHGDSAAGALRLIQRHLQEGAAPSAPAQGGTQGGTHNPSRPERLPC